MFAYGRNKISTDLSVGQYTISINKGDDDKANWVLFFEGKNAGIVETEGIYANQPPENGYTDSIVFLNEDVKGGNKIIRKTIYLFLSEKNMYGNLLLDIRMNLKSKKAVMIGSYSINPSDDRILDTFDNTSG